MYSYEVQDYLEKKSYKLTLEEYYKLVSCIPQITKVSLVGNYEFYHKKQVSTNDNYSWGIYILNYNVEQNKVNDIAY